MKKTGNKLGKDAAFHLVKRLSSLESIMGDLLRGVDFTVSLSPYIDADEIDAWGSDDGEFEFALTDGEKTVKKMEPETYVEEKKVRQMVKRGNLKHVIYITRIGDSPEIIIYIPKDSNAFDYLITEPDFFLFPGNLKEARELYGRDLKLAKRNTELSAEGETPEEAKGQLKYLLAKKGAVGGIYCSHESYDHVWSNKVFDRDLSPKHRVDQATLADTFAGYRTDSSTHHILRCWPVLRS